MKTPLALGFVALTLSACASLSGPSPDDIARLPVVRYGQPAPADGNFVLYYPAGVDLPVIAKIDGSLFSKPDQATLKVRIKQDIYTYRQFISFDGKTWDNGQDRIGGKVSLVMPGDRQGQRDGQSPGELAAEFNLR
ncbi:MAG: putative secreted protein [Proteobacteria bacterium]|nr:putative secreted protein [Pseudomonadota bacterium]